MKKAAKFLIILPAGYLAAWLLAYVVVVGIDFKYVAEYFKLGWTFSGGEYPTYVWLGSVSLYVALLLVTAIYVWVRRRFKRAPNKSLKTDAPKDGAPVS